MAKTGHVTNGARRKRATSQTGHVKDRILVETKRAPGRSGSSATAKTGSRWSSRQPGFSPGRNGPTGKRAAALESLGESHQENDLFAAKLAPMWLVRSGVCSWEYEPSGLNGGGDVDEVLRPRATRPDPCTTARRTTRPIKRDSEAGGKRTQNSCRTR